MKQITVWEREKTVFWINAFARTVQTGKKLRKILLWTRKRKVTYFHKIQDLTVSFWLKLNWGSRDNVSPICNTILVQNSFLSFPSEDSQNKTSKKLWSRGWQVDSDQREEELLSNTVAHNVGTCRRVLFASVRFASQKFHTETHMKRNFLSIYNVIYQFSEAPKTLKPRFSLSNAKNEKTAVVTSTSVTLAHQNHGFISSPFSVQNIQINNKPRILSQKFNTACFSHLPLWNLEMQLLRKCPAGKRHKISSWFYLRSLDSSGTISDLLIICIFSKAARLSVQTKCTNFVSYSCCQRREWGHPITTVFHTVNFLTLYFVHLFLFGLDRPWQKFTANWNKATIEFFLWILTGVSRKHLLNAGRWLVFISLTLRENWANGGLQQENWTPCCSKLSELLLTTQKDVSFVSNNLLSGPEFTELDKKNFRILALVSLRTSMQK